MNASVNIIDDLGRGLGALCSFDQGSTTWKAIHAAPRSTTSKIIIYKYFLQIQKTHGMSSQRFPFIIIPHKLRKFQVIFLCDTV